MHTTHIFRRIAFLAIFALSALCFEGPMDRLTLTANTQPAIVAASASDG